MYNVYYRFEEHEEAMETYDWWQEMMDAIDFNSTYGYVVGDEYEHRVPLKSIEIIFLQ